MYAWQCSKQSFSNISSFNPIMETLWGWYCHLSHFKDGRSKTQTLRNTQGHVPSKWESWILNPSILAPSPGLMTV